MLKSPLVVFLAGLVAISGLALSQDDPRPTVPPGQIGEVPITFSPPGARSLGMGGAFTAIADDATASEANPAGLTILSRPEVSVHFQSSDTDIEVVNLRAAHIEAVTGFTFSSFQNSLSDSESGVPFASFVWPFKRFVVAAYYNESSSFVGDFSSTDQDDLFTASRAVDFGLKTLGLSFALPLGSKVSFGGSIRRTEVDFQGVEEWRIDFGADDYFGTNQTVGSTESDLTYNLGLLFNPAGVFSVGLVYKSGGEFDVSGQATFFDCFGCASPTPGVPGYIEEAVDLPLQTLTIPDFFGVGIAWRLASDRLTLSLDGQRITYSDLSVDPSAYVEEVAGLVEEIDDVTQVHFGAEYIFLVGQSDSPFSIRAGFWTDPDHDPYRDIDSDDVHYSLGLGFVFGENLQIDAAYDKADFSSRGILSAVYRF